ncbi:MAG TPA: MogA/MoaB family molybdenum cofactor biosynthesis protein [Bacteroidales bacterium]|nr:MogA/MoaB family molybdenum cofactor biosynthesis protein [Bacteroidales bacterium]HOK75634.1 MogA/MoaB family molybdenum cofactor biosynthesis protein [Bacteroidales bacterium]HOM40121.1 MogA/MoaB family molybdenum cofactor biosynthesis protein [Bacteroidales bacterium]HOU31653.1 MogA/MoaB family molybdenum cofactor biosynthesis protein [Bacteroidales bacterium]HPP93253.1 MogA/MoaB family molybdenum cofactor biosynthesis protein [Bacteroidales bacterium]
MLPELYRILIITLSDRAYNGEYDDRSGPRIEEILREFAMQEKWKLEVERVVLPDDRDMLHRRLAEAVKRFDIIFTTGGTGIGERDITVETVKPFLTKEIPGIMEYIRVKYGAEKPNALLSRGIAGVAGRCLIYTLPGSVRAVEEYMTEILKTLRHTMEMLYGIDTHKKH